MLSWFRREILLVTTDEEKARRFAALEWVGDGDYFSTPAEERLRLTTKRQEAALLPDGCFRREVMSWINYKEGEVDRQEREAAIFARAKAIRSEIA